MPEKLTDIFKPKLKCNFCYYEWPPRKQAPKCCPSCKRYHWGREQSDAAEAEGA